MYYDANNLYGWSMIQNLSTGDYKWEDVNIWNVDKIMSINENSTTGYIFDVDLEYPKELHDLHNHYPLCPERKLIKSDWLSTYQKELKTKLNVSDDHVEKLVTDLYDKNGYVTHYRNLQLYLQLGLKLKKINKVLSFTQEPLLKDYITSNSLLRQLVRG